jgi:arylamine N-acetyltransferase
MEHCSVMAAGLQALGFAARTAVGEVWQEGAGYSSWLTHYTVLVHLDGETYMVDVSARLA